MPTQGQVDYEESLMTPNCLYIIPRARPYLVPVLRAACRVPRLASAAMVLAVLLLTTPLHAESDLHPIEAELRRCIESPEGASTHGMRKCLGTATAAWDKELNRIWGELMRELGAPAKDSLRAAQRKWIVFRDAELEAQATAYGAMPGTMFLVMHADAVSALTRDRVRQLDAMLEAQRVSVQ